MLPRVAIVGRPNVGKSSLMNRLARRRVSIVDPTPGVTRDRVSTILEIDPPLETPKGTPGRTVEVIDTGGYGVYTAEGKRFDEVGADLAKLTPAIESQIAMAMEEADVILFIIDAQSGPTALDETIARLLRERTRGGDALARVVPVANKCDGTEWVAHGLEAAQFGLGEPVCISAENGYGVRDLLDVIHARVSAIPAQASDTPTADMRLAIVGRRNTGKSTLINALCGQPRVIVSEIAGTTRDAVDVRFEMDGRSFVAIDTAGVRKRKSFADDVEYYAYHRVLQSVRRADVVLFVLDATEEISQVDKKLSLELQRQHKPTVLVVNKVDLLDRDRVAPDDYLEYLTEQLRGLDYAPIVFISAKDGENLRDMVAMAHNLYDQAGHREPTASLNRTIESILQQRGPSSRLGKQAKLYYATQIGTYPPTIVLTVNRPALFEGQYERYLMNRLREELPFSEVPIRLLFQTRGRKDLASMKHAGALKEGADHAGMLEDDADEVE